MTSYRFKKLPADLRRIVVGNRASLIPSDIYEYAKSFRSVYTRATPILKKIGNLESATHEEVIQLHGKAQSLAVQIALSNELLIKAVLLGSKGEYTETHNLKQLIDSLDNRYKNLIEKHLQDNGLKAGRLDSVIEKSSIIFIDVRYGFEGKEYTLDFLTLQLLNEVLDDIYRNYLPDWLSLTRQQKEDKEHLQSIVDEIFSAIQ